MSSASLAACGTLCVCVCLFVHKPVSFLLPAVRFPWNPGSFVFRTDFESLLKTCFLLGQTSVLWTVPPERLHLALGSLVLFRVPSGSCWVSFKRVDCNFLCGFLCLDKTLCFDLFCLGEHFEVLIMEPRRRQLQRDVFMHCSFFGKLKDRREKSQLIMMLKSYQALLTVCTNFQQKSTPFVISPRPVCMYV